MAAALFDGRLRYVTDYPVPARRPGWALIKVRTAGICRTDMEIMQGYLGFRGVLGHEFIGVVAESDDPAWIGRRVAGDINAACGCCEWCARGLGRHCPHRTTLGIVNHDGCLADYCVLPLANLLEIPAAIPDERAILIEPLSAACEILEQISVRGEERIVVIGDGRLGILCAWALVTVASEVTLLGPMPVNWRCLSGEGSRRLWLPTLPRLMGRISSSRPPVRVRESRRPSSSAGHGA